MTYTFLPASFSMENFITGLTLFTPSLKLTPTNFLLQAFQDASTRFAKPWQRQLVLKNLNSSSTRYFYHISLSKNKHPSSHCIFKFLEYFFEDADAAFFKSLGLNCIRLPFNYRHFEGKYSNQSSFLSFSSYKLLLPIPNADPKSITK